MQLGLVPNIPAALNIDVNAVWRRPKKKISALDFVVRASACFFVLYDQILMRKEKIIPTTNCFQSM